MMAGKDLTLTDVERLQHAADADVAFQMDEETFRGFYDRTARPLWSYLSRITGSAQLADDLLQESYYRFLRVRSPWESESHRRADLFRIATNLARDGYRRSVAEARADMPPPEHPSMAAPGRDQSEVSAERTDLHRALSRLRQRDRALLWLAYAQGRAHAEIAETLGVKTGSIKLLLFRARRRLAAILRAPGSARTTGQEDGRGTH